MIQTHTNLMQKTRVCADAFGTTPADRFAIFSTYAVGQGIMTALNALLFGAALCPYDVRHLGLEALADWLKRERITIYVASASLFRSFVRGFDGSTRFDDLRMIRIGGERVTPADVAAYRRVFTPTTRLLISYSATETGPISMHWVDDNEHTPMGSCPSVARPTASPFSSLATMVASWEPATRAKSSFEALICRLATGAMQRKRPPCSRPRRIQTVSATTGRAILGESVRGVSSISVGKAIA